MQPPCCSSPFGVISVNVDSGYRLVRVNAPGFFSAPGFKEFLESSGVATWHTKGNDPTDYSDVFVTLDGDGEGCHSPLCYDGTDTVPPAVWTELVKSVRSVIPSGTCLIWLTNLQESEAPVSLPAQTVAELTDARRQAADDAFENHDFGRCVVTDCCSWTEDGVYWSRWVYGSTEEGGDFRVSFGVEFEKGTTKIVDAWVQK